jgi:hypothetical protein
VTGRDGVAADLLDEVGKALDDLARRHGRTQLRPAALAA